LLGEIQQALINNDLVLYYQPKVNMRTGDVFGAEALLAGYTLKKASLSSQCQHSFSPSDVPNFYS
jgi:EAL domain-containing protein (putative c-di-GMP-specific phosphodiesterase class I)